MSHDSTWYNLMRRERYLSSLNFQVRYPCWFYCLLRSQDVFKLIIGYDHFHQLLSNGKNISWNFLFFHIDEKKSIEAHSPEWLLKIKWLQTSTDSKLKFKSYLYREIISSWIDDIQLKNNRYFRKVVKKVENIFWKKKLNALFENFTIIFMWDSASLIMINDRIRNIELKLRSRLLDSFIRSYEYCLPYRKDWKKNLF